ncbi:hypothetical protein RAH32_03565 [Paracoccus sp. WLY502]|uniref:hypothetical protein n=1 Tax=Paracoccus yibinensis TaxID=3068891 RepID=UPI0027964CF8|nr:hypothetical protein [Paracoccus sp. WLY502]MDQ1899523.1 hypothetical protein [Paracoccus sp. WLY502]
MIWVAQMLAGPMLWGGLFSAVYGLHGLGCALDWPDRATPLGPLHPGGMILLWLVGLGLHGLLVALNRAGGSETQRLLVRSGNWVGAVASAVTLLPVIVTSSCG